MGFCALGATCTSGWETCRPPSGPVGIQGPLPFGNDGKSPLTTRRCRRHQHGQPEFTTGWPWPDTAKSLEPGESAAPHPRERRRRAGRTWSTPPPHCSAGPAVGQSDVGGGGRPAGLSPGAPPPGDRVALGELVSEHA